MHAVGDHVEADILVKQSPTYRSRRAMMKRRHRVHEVRHVLPARCFRLIEDIRRGARVANRDNPAAASQLANQCDAASDFRRDSRQVNSILVLEGR